MGLVESSQILNKLVDEIPYQNGLMKRSYVNLIYSLSMVETVNLVDLVDKINHLKDHLGQSFTDC